MLESTMALAAVSQFACGCAKVKRLMRSINDKLSWTRLNDHLSFKSWLKDTNWSLGLLIRLLHVGLTTTCMYRYTYVGVDLSPRTSRSLLDICAAWTWLDYVCSWAKRRLVQQWVVVGCVEWVPWTWSGSGSGSFKRLCNLRFSPISFSGAFVNLLLLVLLYWNYIVYTHTNLFVGSNRRPSLYSCALVSPASSEV